MQAGNGIVRTRYRAPKAGALPGYATSLQATRAFRWQAEVQLRYN